MRIVSLLPSATEIVCSLGLEEQLAGISHSCDYPPGIRGLPVLTRTAVPLDATSGEIDAFVRRYLGDHSALYQLDLQRLEEVAPNIVVSQRLCDVCAVSTREIETALGNISSRPRLVDLEPSCLEDIYADILKVGVAAGVKERAEALIAGLRQRVEVIALKTRNIVLHKRPRVAMLEWLDPPFSSGHWNPELVELAGAIDCIGPRGKPSLTVSWQEVIDSNPDVLLIACCGHDIERATSDLISLAHNAGWQELIQQVRGRVLVSDGDAYFSRPGPRLIDGLEALAFALHPELHENNPPAAFQWLNIQPG